MSSKRNIKVYDPTYKEHKPLFVGEKSGEKEKRIIFFFSMRNLLNIKRGKTKHLIIKKITQT